MIDFKKTSIELKTLVSDVGKIIANKKKEGASLQTMEDLTVVRKDEETVKKAGENPEFYFICDSIERILGVGRNAPKSEGIGK